MKKRILIVEDDRVMGEKLIQFLEKCSYATELVTNARAAYAALSRPTDRFDVVVCDDNFPLEPHTPLSHARGLEILRFLRSSAVKGYQHTPFILHTSDDTASFRRRVTEEGGVYCCKRFVFSFYGLFVLIEAQLASVVA